MEERRGERLLCSNNVFVLCSNRSSLKEAGLGGLKEAGLGVSGSLWGQGGRYRNRPAGGRGF